MTLFRRQFLHLAAGAAALTTVSRIAWAQAYPTRSVRMIVPFPAGGSTDVLARLMGQRLSVRLAQPFLVENRPGATGNIGTEAVVRAPADGYTLLLATTTNVVNATVYDNLNFNFTRDIVPVAGVMNTSHVMVVHPLVPARTIPEFIAYARANPAKINMASAGNGSNNHVAGELFKMRAGVDILHVPYRGGAPAVTGLLAGEIDMLLTDIPVVLPHVQSGAFKALGLASDQRSPILPDVPTVTEAGIAGVIAEGWYAMYAPTGTPAIAINTLQAAFADVLARDAVKQAIIGIGGVVQSSSPAELTAYQRAEYAKWGEVVRVSGAKMN